MPLNGCRVFEKFSSRPPVHALICPLDLVASRENPCQNPWWPRTVHIACAKLGVSAFAIILGWLSTRLGLASTTMRPDIWGFGVRDSFFWWFNDFFTFLKKEKLRQSTQIHIHSHRDLGLISVTSSTDKMDFLGPIPSRWRISAPRVLLRRAAASSYGGNISRSVNLNQTAFNLQFPWVYNYRHRHLWEVVILYRAPLLSSKGEIRRILIHTV